MLSAQSAAPRGTLLEAAFPQTAFHLDRERVTLGPSINIRHTIQVFDLGRHVNIT